MVVNLKEAINKAKTFLADIALFKLLNKENRILISNDFRLVAYCKYKGLNAFLLEEIFYF